MGAGQPQMREPTAFTRQVGRNINMFREMRGLSVSEFGRRAGIAHSLAYAVIRGQPTTTRTLEKIARALRVPPYQLLLSDVDRIILEETARTATLAHADHHRGAGSLRQDDTHPAPD